MANEQPTQKRHRKRFDQPIDKQGHPDAAYMLFDFVQRRKVNFDQHGNDHHPNEQAHWQIDLRYFPTANELKNSGHPLT